MNLKFITLFIFTLISFVSLSANDLIKHRDFFVITIPKSGTHLVMKLLKVLIDKEYQYPKIKHGSAFDFPEEYPEMVIPEEDFEESIFSFKNTEYYPLSHMNYTVLYKRFAAKHPEYAQVVLIRDLRDTLISCVNFLWRAIEDEIGPSTFDQKLSFLINLRYRQTKNRILNIYRNAEKALEWANDPDVVLLRFEDLVGEKGGGNREAQEKSILKLANALNITISDAKLNHTVKILFGKDLGPQIPSTFRDGKIGKWKRLFKPHHLRDFNKKWGNLQRALGYSIDRPE